MSRGEFQLRMGLTHDGRNRCSGSPESLFRIPVSAFTIPESVFTMDRNQCSGWSGIRNERIAVPESNRFAHPLRHTVLDMLPADEDLPQ